MNTLHYKRGAVTETEVSTSLAPNLDAIAPGALGAG